jgi:hypothetical protein
VREREGEVETGWQNKHQAGVRGMKGERRWKMIKTIGWVGIGMQAVKKKAW